MANLLLISPSTTLYSTVTASPTRGSFRPSHVPFNRPAIQLCRNKSRGVMTVVTRAGPSTSNYVFAFVLPLSLLVLTVFASLKLDDTLERQYLEELILNEAMKEQEEDDDDDDDDDDEADDAEADDDEADSKVFMEEKLLERALPRTRNRPKREV